MASSRYDFITRWSIPAPIEQVWAELMVPENWPIWWPGVEQVVLLEPGLGAHGSGAVRRFTWKSRLPYRLSFTMKTTRIDPCSTIEGEAFGELEGFGRWSLVEADGVTQVRYDWQVVANKWWMRWLAPIARPIFEWNHDVVMAWGQTGLLRRLQIEPNPA